jgi:hypothetical protein
LTRIAREHAPDGHCITEGCTPDGVPIGRKTPPGIGTPGAILMVAPDSGLDPADYSIDTPSGPPPETLDSSGGWGRLLGMALAAGLLAGVVAWLAGEAILEAYRAVLSPKIQREVDVEAVRQFAKAHLTSASGTFTALGAILGLSLGLAGGLARRSASAGARAALLGCVIGSIAGVSCSLLVLPNFFKNQDPQSQDLVLPLLTIGSICSAVGATGGLAFGIGLGGRDRWRKSLLGGLLGAGLGAVVYEVVGAIAFPAGKTELAISITQGTRAMLHVLVAALAAVGSALALGLSSKKRDAASPAL